MKDALATFDRQGVNIHIKSKYNNITIGKYPKKDFNEILTLHAVVGNPTDSDMVGTEFVFENISELDIETAKDFFLIYSEEVLIEKTKYGEILKSKNHFSRIYVNGLSVAEEDNYLFSYNITSPTKKLLKSLNRERTNVGRTAYSDRLKSILLDGTSSELAEQLVNDLEKIHAGSSHDELQWIDVQVHACKILNAQGNVIFLTPYQLADGGKYISYAKAEGLRIVPITESLAKKLPKINDIKGNAIMDFDNFSSEWNDRFEFKFVDIMNLTKNEVEVFNYAKTILGWYPNSNSIVKNVLISETMQPDKNTNTDSLGLWDPGLSRIIIKRSQLKKVELFAGTFLHELVHAYTDTDDNTIEFENELTKMLGKVAAISLKEGKSKRLRIPFFR